MRVVFLDIDGVLCTPRAALALGDSGVIRAFDPIAIQFLNRLYEAAPYLLVMTSTWRRDIGAKTAVKASGCYAQFHTDWRTGDRWASGDIVESMHARPAEIRDWLEKNGPAEFLILDDDPFAWTPEQASRVVECDSYDGISFAAMNKAFDLFGTKWPQLSRPSPTESESAALPAASTG
jgi:hypothetical protein